MKRMYTNSVKFSTFKKTLLSKQFFFIALTYFYGCTLIGMLTGISHETAQEKPHTYNVININGAIS